MLLSERFPKITSVLPAYFYLEWYEVQGPTLADQVRSLLDSEPAESLAALNAEVERFLESPPALDEQLAWIHKEHVDLADDELPQLLAEIRRAYARRAR
jgi:hypothetical protein